ncbi:MAG TPA: PEGA domain-containing protein [Blastocatellia bacterium]|nr:PEGA domain-containing protein [Blastocatellia bacterium]
MKRRFSALVFACSLTVLAACTRPVANQNSPGAANANQNANRSAANQNSRQQQPAAPAQDPALGSIDVTSTPSGAVILLIAEGEGSAGAPQRKGSTPQTLTNIEPGKYTVAIEKPGYKAFQKEIKVEPSKTVKVAASLRKQ